MAKMRTSALRKLHADLGQILADYDASCAAETGEDDATPPRTSGAPHNAPAGGAQDAAIRSGAFVADEDPVAAARSRAMRAEFGPNWSRLSR
jgi:hypothetical protein